MSHSIAAPIVDLIHTSFSQLLISTPTTKVRPPKPISNNTTFFNAGILPRKCRRPSLNLHHTPVYLPFDDRNLVVIYQKICKGDVQMHKWMTPGAQSLIKRILDPNPKTRIIMIDIKAVENQELPTHVNAFELIGMSWSLDLLGFFEKEF
uniref:non-specific serine/threonine protein kinase n=1 Tax=Lactuca sativa TaxID=4236 RepID=A0A9R1W1T5_LACSA|nr:hypothetical protein LSAT_V11C400165470 [Lactuca sativa]